MAAFLDTVWNILFTVTDKSSPTLKKVGQQVVSTENEITKSTKVFSTNMQRVGKGVMFSMGAMVGSITALYNKVRTVGSKLVSSAVEYENTWVGLGKSMYSSREELGKAYEDLGKLVHYQGLSVEEAKEMVEVGRDFGLTGNKLVTWAKSSIDYARATGQSEAAVGKLFYRMTRLYNLGDSQLRGIGSAMKYVASQTNISNDELLSFAGSLEGFYRMGPSRSKTATGQMTTDMLALAGAFKEGMGESADKLPEIMKKMMDPYQGRQIATMFAKIMGRGVSSEQVLTQLQNDPARLWLAFGKGLTKYGKNELKRMGPLMEEMVGLSVEDMLSLQDMAMRKGDKSLEHLMANARKKYDQQKLAAEAAEKQAKWLQTMMDQMKLEQMQFWNEMAKPAIEFLKGFLKPFGDMMMKLTGFIKGKNGKDTLTYFRDLGEYVGKWVETNVLAGLKWIEKNWADIVKWAKRFVEWTKAYMEVGRIVLNLVLKITNALGATGTATLFILTKMGMLKAILVGIPALFMGMGGINQAVRGGATYAEALSTQLKGAGSAAKGLNGINWKGGLFMIGLAAAAAAAGLIADKINEAADRIGSLVDTKGMFTNWAAYMESEAVKLKKSPVLSLSEYLQSNEAAFTSGKATKEQRDLLTWAKKIDEASRKSPAEIGKISEQLTRSTVNIDADSKKMLMGYATQLQMQMSDPTRQQNFQPMMGKITGTGFALPEDVHVPEMSLLVKKLDNSKLVESLDGLTTALTNPGTRRKVEQSVVPNPPLVH